MGAVAGELEHLARSRAPQAMVGGHIWPCLAVAGCQWGPLGRLLATPVLCGLLFITSP